MTDKEKIRAEVERRRIMNFQRKQGSRSLEDMEILSFIDSLPEEPKTNWLQELQERLDSLSKEDFEKVWDKYDRYGKEESVSLWHDASETPEVDRTFLLVAPNGNSSLCLWGGKELHSVTLGGGHLSICQGDKWAYVNDLIHKKDEPVSEDLEEACEQLAEKARMHKAETISPFFSQTDYKQGVIDGAKWQKQHLWKPADGDDLPPIDKEVVVFTQDFPDDAGMMSVAIGHRPNPDGWDGKSLRTGKVEHYMPRCYDKGGWNIPNVVYWLDIELPRDRGGEIELKI